MPKLARQAVSFGILSSVMTLLPFQLGIVLSGNRNVREIIASIVAMSVADSMADAYGIYFSDQAMHPDTGKGTADTPARAAVITFITKIALQLSFAVPFFLFRGVKWPSVVNATWGIVAIGVTSYKVAQFRQIPATPYVLRTLGFTLIIILGSYGLSNWITKST